MAPGRHVILQVFLLLPGVLFFSALLGAQTQPAVSDSAASTAKKKTPAAASPARNTGKKSPSTTRSSSKASARKTTARRAPPPAADQSRPTKDRYAEIQTALAKAGYYSGAKDGNWSDDSVRALQRFQQDQGLEPTGKIDSLSLIRLNLGPHHDTDGTSSDSSSKPAGQAG